VALARVGWATLRVASAVVVRIGGGARASPAKRKKKKRKLTRREGARREREGAKQEGGEQVRNTASSIHKSLGSKKNKITI
jgi:hypothetical protein